MSDEAHFHLTGYVNKQNYRYWADNNPKEVNEHSLHSSKVTVWCAVSSHRVIGPYFFENEERITMTVTSDRYVDMLQSFVAPALNNFPHLHEAWFQQDGATSHTARQSMAAVRELFGNRVISRFGDIPWSPRSPNLSVYDFSCGATLRIGSTRLGQGHWMNSNKESKMKYVISQLRCCSRQWGPSMVD